MRQTTLLVKIDDHLGMSPCPPDARLAGVLIVKDEEANLADSLRSIQGVVDCVHVHDTGSSDGTIELATSFGAEVTQGQWTGDFSRARNDSLRQVTASWVLSIDADDRLVVKDAGILKAFLDETQVDVLEMEVDNVQDQAIYTNVAVKLFRNHVGQWQGKVHEQLVAVGRPLVVSAMPREVAHIFHVGYSDQQTREQKATRNAAIGEEMLTQLDHSDESTFALLDLGRSYAGAGRRQEAIAVFGEIRTLYPDSLQWMEATDFLARQLLAEGEADKALIVSQELRQKGGSSQYCDWLDSQAFIQLGDFAKAWTLLLAVDEVVDSAGRRHDPSALGQLKNLVGQLREQAAK